MSAHVWAIGPSTGYLFAKFIGSSLDDHMVVLRKAEATAAEMVLWDRVRTNSILSGALGPPVCCISLHLDSFEAMKGPSDFDDYAAVCERHQIQTAVFHPDHMTAYAYKNLVRRHIPLAIENMDRQKRVGKTAEDILALGRQFPDCRFVLDVQHAYENSKDSGGDGIELALQLTDAMQQQKGIAHLHVSGELEIHGKQVLNHAQMHIATNRRHIIEATRRVIDRVSYPVPIILEGEYLLRIPYGYVADSPHERLDLLHEAADEMVRERECLLNELNV